jgi:3-deoxy-7-phosphoheptulonate synthase
VGLVGNDGRVDGSRIEALSGVQEVIHVSKPYKQVSREWKAESTIVLCREDSRSAVKMSWSWPGPCSVESEQQILAGRRGGAGGRCHGIAGWGVQATQFALFIQGLGVEGLHLLRLAKAETGTAHRHRGDGSRGRRPSCRGRPTSFRSARGTCRTIPC